MFPPWRRNLFAVTAAVFVGFTGFTLVMPFLPLYLGQLGLTDVGDIAFWAGLSLGATPAITAICAPFWGRLSDRLGRKLMLERSLFSFVVVMAAMAYATAAWHVFALRVVQGLFAGYGPLALAMAADASPRDRLASSIGLVQTAQRLGPALGPVIGGAIAQAVGLRRAFLVSSAFYLLGFLLVLALYREERPAERPSAAARAERSVAAGGKGPGGLPGSSQLILLTGVIFALQFVDRSFGPVLPLWLAEAGVPLTRVPVLSGVLFTLMAGAGALGNTMCAWLLSHAAPRTVIGVASATAGAACLAFALLPAPGPWFVAAAVCGVAIGTAMTAAYTSAGSVIPPESRGRGFGWLTSASLAGLAVSPVVAGTLGRGSILAVFVLDVAVMAGVAGVVARRPTRALGGAGRSGP